MSTLIDKNLFKITFLLLILAEILSFFGWLLPSFNIICFFVIIFLTLILSLKKLEWGIYILLAELFIGSKGYLFALSMGDTLVSVRMGLFLVVMGVWLFQIINWVGSTLLGGAHCKLLRAFAKWLQPRGWSQLPAHRDVSPSEAGPYFASAGTSQRALFTPLFVVIIWAFVWGLIRGNNFGNVFLDFNNWLYFLIMLPVFWTYNKKNNNFIKNILTVLTAAVVWLSIKSLILLYIFSHQFAWALPEVYKWVRDTGVGEITYAGSGFWRVFMQSQIYALLLFFILFPLLSFRSRIAVRDKLQPESSFINFIKQKFAWIPTFVGMTKKKARVTKWGLLILCLTIVLLSWSRSYWAGLFVGLFLYFIILFFLLITHYTLLITLLQILLSFAKIATMAAISFAIIFTIINLPPKIDGGDLAALLGNRATETEAASSSRMNQLKPLLLAISKHPLIGSGFGATVTYFSNDLRIVPATAGGTGEITTYAFEWGYLDLLLKFGLVGVGVYLFLIFIILKRLLISNSQFLISNKVLNFKSQISNIENYQLPITHYLLQLGFALALIALLVVNIFSPYLNHPLGIGFVIMCLLIALIDMNQKQIDTN